MGHRREQRFRKELEVKIYGLDRLGQPFSQTASVVDVSEQGVRLEGVDVLDSAGATVILEHNGSKAQYRVVWVGGYLLAGQAGLVKLEPHKSIFDLRFPPPAPDNYVVQPPEQPAFDDGLRRLLEDRRQAEGRKGERRRYKRYDCCGEAEIYAPGAERPERGKFTDLSRGGCFVELLPPIALDTEVTVVLLLAQSRVRVQGLVRSVMPNFGLGIQFLRFEPEDLRQLEGLLAALEQGTSLNTIAPLAQPPVAPPAGTPPPDAQRALEALRSWFATSEVLTRQEFCRLLENPCDSGQHRRELK